MANSHPGLPMLILCIFVYSMQFVVMKGSIFGMMGWVEIRLIYSLNRFNYFFSRFIYLSLPVNAGRCTFGSGFS